MTESYRNHWDQLAKLYTQITNRPWSANSGTCFSKHRPNDKRCFPKMLFLQTTLGRFETNFSAFMDFPLNFSTIHVISIIFRTFWVLLNHAQDKWPSLKSPNLRDSWLRGGLGRNGVQNAISLSKALSVFVSPLGRSHLLSAITTLTTHLGAEGKSCR